jgi:hypothetical protein
VWEKFSSASLYSSEILKKMFRMTLNIYHLDVGLSSNATDFKGQEIHS